MITFISDSINCLLKLKHRQHAVTCAAVVFTSLCLSSFQAAGSIINGDFETGDLSGWQQDNGVSFNDGFSVVNNGSSNVALIQAQAEDGANGFTLFQDVTAIANTDSQLNLSFDWLFSGVGSGEFFVVNLFNGTHYFAADGSFGELFYVDTHGSGTINILLDLALFPLSSMWSLEFQLNTGFDFFDDSALLQIDNVKLRTTDVREPAAYLFFLMVLCMLSYFSMKQLKGNIQSRGKMTRHARVVTLFAQAGN
jgi:hypothetical protein